MRSEVLTQVRYRVSHGVYATDSQGFDGPAEPVTDSHPGTC